MVPVDPVSVAPVASARAKPVSDEAIKDLNAKFEKMLWAEMLRHSGMEEAFTKSGGQAAAAFTQFAIEAIAEDLAERQPFGFNSVERTMQAYEQLAPAGGRNE